MTPPRNSHIVHNLPTLRADAGPHFLRSGRGVAAANGAVVGNWAISGEWTR